jgi:hypothetical protein
MANILCSDPGHAGRSAAPGWRAVLGTGPAGLDGMLCDACYQAREAGAVEDPTDARSAVLVMQGGDYALTNVRVFNGQVIGTIIRTGKVQNKWTGPGPGTEINTFKALVAKL